LLGRTTGLVYVPHDESGPMKDACPEAQLGNGGPPWIAVDLDTEKVIVTAWPGKLWRVRVLRRATEQPMPYARYVRADRVEVLDIYAASEEPIEGVTAGALVKAIGRDGVRYAGSVGDGVEALVKDACEGDVILTLGAGSVSQVGAMMLERLESAVGA